LVLVSPQRSLLSKEKYRALPSQADERSVDPDQDTGRLQCGRGDLAYRELAPLHVLQHPLHRAAPSGTGSAARSAELSVHLNQRPTSSSMAETLARLVEAVREDRVKKRLPQCASWG